VKDEDWRLSFLYGNYVTLNSLDRRGLQRICTQKLSPLYVSVHATDVGVRTRLLGVRKRVDILRTLDILGAAGITVHAQVVLCPGWNDGPVLQQTFADLLQRYPQVASLTVVPVGLTSHRAKLPSLSPVTPAGARALLEQTAQWQRQARRQTGRTFLQLSDEFYLLADAPFPAAASYDAFPQLDTGAGLTVRLREIWERDLARAARRGRRLRGSLTILTGHAACQAFGRELMPLLARFEAPPLDVVPVTNGLYGPGVTVAGLLAGTDVRRALRALPASPRRTVFLCGAMFNSEGLTLDNMDLAGIAGDQPHAVHSVPTEGLVDFWLHEG
jgi:putative radical SAM enzyme (TIGR03279 family)